MNFPTIFDWLDTFSFMRGYPSTWIILGTGIVIALFLDWRLSLFALIVQYLIASLLFFDLLNPQLAIIKLFVGMFVCLILYWTARQVNYGRADKIRLRLEGNKFQLGRFSISRNLITRVAAITVALLLVAFLEWGISFYFPGLPQDLGYINLAILLLLTLGVAGLITSRDALPAGMSILTFLTGFELYFAAVDQSTRTLALLASLNFIVALTVSYLVQRRYTRIISTFNNE